MHRYVVDDAMSTLSRSLRNSGEAFGLMSRAWLEELECGHRRGEKKAYWLTERSFGVVGLPYQALRKKVEEGLGLLSDVQLNILISRLHPSISSGFTSPISTSFWKVCCTFQRPYFTVKSLQSLITTAFTYCIAKKDRAWSQPEIFYLSSWATTQNLCLLGHCPVFTEGRLACSRSCNDPEVWESHME